MTAPSSSGQTAQEGLAIVAGQDAGNLASLIDVSDIAGSSAAFTAAVSQIVTKYGQASSTLAARQYAMSRQVAGLTSRFTVIPAKPAPLKQVNINVGWALQDLYGSSPKNVVFRDNIESIVERLVLNAGRQTITDNVKRDPKATGWVRLTEMNPCSFCATLATRGAVYKSEKTADFKAHNHCRCHADPVFGPYELTAQVQAWKDLYRSSTAGIRGTKEKLNAFRAAFATPTQ